MENKRTNRKKRGVGVQPSCPGPFSRLLRHAGVIQRSYSVYPLAFTKGGIYIWGAGSLGLIVGGQGACIHVILILCECIWNAPMVLLVLPTFDNTGSLGFPPHQVVYPPDSTLGECLSFPCGK